MTSKAVDIIVPVWNRPIETRACLVSLISNTSDIRLILLDNSSDRETEQMLGEFAEALDVSALFLKNQHNEGFVKAVNRALTFAGSEFIAIFRQSSIARPGWLKPLLEFMSANDDAGIVVPGYSPKRGNEPSLCRGMEISSGNFAAMLMRKSLIQAVGSFRDDMDGDSWCLRDYSRRAWQAGYKTFAVPDGVVETSEELQLGSPARRAEQGKIIRDQFRISWGDEAVYCLHLPKGSDPGSLEERLPLIATAARHGNRVMILAHPSLMPHLARLGYDRCHEYLSVHSYARLLSERSSRRTFEGCASHGLPLTHVSWESAFCFPCGNDTIPFSEFENSVMAHEKRFYKSSTIPADVGRSDGRRD